MTYIFGSPNPWPARGLSTCRPLAFGVHRLLAKGLRGKPFMAVGGKAKGVLGPGTRGVPPAEIVFGRSPVMQPIKHLVGKILSADLPVLIQGENGTGKGVLAQFIHVNSPRRSGSFVKVNCAAIPAALLESELFGYE